MTNFRYPAQSKRLAAGEINRWNVAADESEKLRGKIIARQTPDDLMSWPVWVRNDTGRDCWRYETLALGEPVIPLETDGSVDLFFKGLATDDTKRAVILLDNIAIDAFGKGFVADKALALVSPGDADIRRAKPHTGEYRLIPDEGGPIVLL